MKKMRRSGSARKSRSSSRSSIFSGRSSPGKKKTAGKKRSFFAKKHSQSASMGKSGKTCRAVEEKKRFIKPPHDPGSKIREEEVEVVEDYQGGEDGEAIQQALQSTGSGCCGSITGFFWLLAIGGFAVVIIFILKCGGC